MGFVKYLGSKCKKKNWKYIQAMLSAVTGAEKSRLDSYFLKEKNSDTETNKIN